MFSLYPIYHVLCLSKQISPPLHDHQDNVSNSYYSCKIQAFETLVGSTYVVHTVGHHYTGIVQLPSLPVHLIS